MDIYDKHIIRKYKSSKKIYKNKLADDNHILYLYYFDLMNTYSIFPTIIEYPIHNYIKSKNNNINKIINEDYDVHNNDDISVFTKKMEKKINQYNKLISDPKHIDNNKVLYEKYGQNVQPIRRFFFYDLTDELTKNYNAEGVTIAWAKCYELLYHYKLLDSEGDKTCFCICEQPGAFVYAINHYSKQYLGKNVSFILQSLNSTFYGSFPPDKYLYAQHKEIYDYGPEMTGDIMDINNIKYYRAKYYEKMFTLITADCGVDCSDDFTKQENNSLEFILGQFIAALGLCDEGTNYFFKLFTIYESVTQQLIYLLGLLFDNVFITRTLATKINSGEIYCVCKKFKYKKKKMDVLFNNLCNWYSQYKKSNNINLLGQLIDGNYFTSIRHINKVLLYKRLLNYNFMYFKNNNYEISFKNKAISDYIYNLAIHYVKYFIELYKITSLDNINKLVNHKFSVK